MFTQMRTENERATRFVALMHRVRRHVAGLVSRPEAFGTSLDSLALATAATTANATFAWNTKPCVRQTAISTHGKPYARRLQEILT